jgi:hypothetical protein
MRGGSSAVGVRAVALAIATLSMVAWSDASAGAAAWQRVRLPNVTDHPDSALVQGGGAPYRIDWPGEGTSTSGEQDPACPLDPPFRDSRRVRSGSPGPDDKLIGVGGIWKRGGFVRVGNPTSGANHAGNHLAAFFHTPDLDGRPCFRGGGEYGFLRKLAEGSTRSGDQPLDFYQCWNCNCKPSCGVPGGGTVTERWTDKQTGWRDAQTDRIYRISFSSYSYSSFGVRCAFSRDNFVIGVLEPTSPPTLRYSVRMCRASWLPDLNGASGWITVNSHADQFTSDGVDHFEGSYNQVVVAKWLPS